MKKAQQAPLLIQTMIWALVVATLATGWVPQESKAMLAPATSATLETGSGLDRAEDLQSIQRVLENKIVQQRLEDLGLTPEEINNRLIRLSDAQLHQMATQIDALMPGGDVDLSTIIALFLVLLIVLLIVALV